MTLAVYFLGSPVFGVKRTKWALALGSNMAKLYVGLTHHKTRY